MHCPLQVSTWRKLSTRMWPSRCGTLEGRTSCGRYGGNTWATRTPWYFQFPHLLWSTGLLDHSRRCVKLNALVCVADIRCWFDGQGPDWGCQGGVPGHRQGPAHAQQRSSSARQQAGYGKLVTTERLLSKANRGRENASHLSSFFLGAERRDEPFRSGAAPGPVRPQEQGVACRGGLRAHRRGSARGARLAGGDPQGRAHMGNLRPLLVPGFFFFLQAYHHFLRIGRPFGRIVNLSFGSKICAFIRKEWEKKLQECLKCSVTQGWGLSTEHWNQMSRPQQHDENM